MACPFLASSIRKLEIKFTQIQENCWVKHRYTLTQKVQYEGVIPITC